MHKKIKDKVRMVTLWDVVSEDAENNESIVKLLNQGYEPFTVISKPIRHGTLEPAQYILKDIMWLKRKKQAQAIITTTQRDEVPVQDDPSVTVLPKIIV